MLATALPISSTDPAASVVIPCRDRQGSLERTLTALALQDTRRSFEVIVVDDGSEPPLAGLPVDVRVLRRHGDGPAAARNAGAQLARAPILLFTDDDTIPSESWVEAACGFFDRRPDAVAVEGPVRSPPFDYLYAHSLRSAGPGAYWTCNIAYRREVFARLGGFEERFPYPHCEDLDIAYRAARLGDIGFAPQMAIVHVPRQLSLYRLILRGRMTASEALLFARHRDRFGRARVLPPRLFPVVSAVHTWWAAARDEPNLLSSPRRAGRFLVAAVGYVLVVVATALRPRALTLR